MGEVGKVVWGEDSSWGDESVGLSGVEKLREVGIVVEKRELRWEEQLVVEADKFRCFETSRLGWSWRVMGEEDLIEENVEEGVGWVMEYGCKEEKVVEGDEMGGEML